MNVTIETSPTFIVDPKDMGECLIEFSSIIDQIIWAKNDSDLIFRFSKYCMKLKFYAWGCGSGHLWLHRKNEDGIFQNRVLIVFMNND